MMTMSLMIKGIFMIHEDPLVMMDLVHSRVYDAMYEIYHHKVKVKERSSMAMHAHIIMHAYGSMRMLSNSDLELYSRATLRGMRTEASASPYDLVSAREMM